MIDIDIHVELSDLLEKNNAKKGIANIWIDIDGVSFPEKNWSDYLFWIVVEWSSKVVELLEGLSCQNTLIFIDGPYGIELVKIEGCLYLAKVGTRISSPSHIDPEFLLEIDVKDFARKLEKTNQKIIEFVHSNSVESEYFELVVEGDRKLKEVNEKHRNL